MPGRINIGAMDRYVLAQTKTETKSLKGSVIATWEDAFWFYAAQTDNIVNESFSTIGFVAPVTTTFSTHFRTDLVRTMRLIMDGEYWNIVNIARDRISMKLECQRMDD